MAQTVGDSLLILAGVFAIAGIAMGSVLRMRLAFFAAGLLALVHFALVGWNATALALSFMFLVAGGIRLMSLLRHTRSGSILDDERELFTQVMQVEDPANQRRLRDVLRWQDIAAGEVLMHQGDKLPPLVYIAQGSAAITHDDVPVGTCGPGDFLGEMSVISGEQASATVVASEEMRIAKFDRAALGEMVRVVPELGRAIDGALNRSLAAKLLRMNQSTGAPPPEE